MVISLPLPQKGQHMLKPFSILFFFAFIFVSYGQQNEISGTVFNLEGLPVPYANIVVSNTEKPPRPISYGYSNDKGAFTLKIPKNISNVVLNLTAIGYKEKSVSIQLDTMRIIEVSMENSVTALQEVVLKTRPNTDTLNLDIHNMNLTAEKTLRDMLNKTDGFIVSEEGGISYQGKQINKVFINGKEVFVSQNKVALDNLDYEIMNNVQVINNYKDKFTIGFNRVRDPIINIETKPEFNGILKSEVDLGYGFKNKYDLNGKGFFFSDNLNAFVTSNTNNTGEVTLTQNDVSASITKNVTNSLRNLLYPFFVEDFQTKESFVSNSSITLRREGENSKMGLVFYHGNINVEREKGNSTFIGDTLVKKSKFQNRENGSFVSAIANYSHKISEKTVLENVFSLLAVKHKEYSSSIDSIFTTNPNSFIIQTDDVSKNFTAANNLKITQLLNENLAFDLDLDYYYERNYNNLDSRFIDDVGEEIVQDGYFNKKNFSALGRFKFRLKEGSFNTGIGIKQNNELGSLSFIDNTNEDNTLSRKVTSVQLPISIQGSIKKIDYSLSVSPTLIQTKEMENRGLLKMSHRITYNFKAQNNLILELKRNNRFYNLNSLYDTLRRSYNHRLVNKNNNIGGYSVSDEVSLSWFNTNVARSKRFHFIYEYSREKDFMQSVLDSISDNVFYYANRVFDLKETHNFSTGANKGFYFGSEYHRFDIGGDVNFALNNYPTIINNQYTQASSNSWKPSFNLGLRPRGFFVREMNNRINWNYLVFRIDGEEVTRQSVLTNTFTLEGSEDDLDWEIHFEYRFYEIAQEKFNVPDINLALKYDLSDKIAFSLTGRSLLTLFQLNNYNFVNTFSDGNTLTQTTTNNNLGYLLFNTSFKF